MNTECCEETRAPDADGGTVCKTLYPSIEVGHVCHTTVLCP